MSNTVRKFKVKLEGEEDSKYRGRFTGKNAQQAGKKALTSLLRESGKKTGTIKFTVRETTQGSKKRTYTYSGKREKRKTPNKVFFPNSSKPVLYKYDTTVHSCK